jgi:uncharacterized membrane protein YccC
MAVMTKFVSLVSRHTLWSEGHVFAISPERLCIMEGIRASIAIGAMLAAAIVFNIPDFAFGAVAAFWNCLCDPLGSNESRLHAMGFFSLMGAIAIMLASYGAHWGPIASVLTLFLLVFLCGLTRAYNAAFGPAPAQAGLLASLAVIIGITTPRDVSGALTLSGFFLLGSAWTILLTVYVWPIRTQATAERTLASLFARLEDMAAFLQELDEQDEPGRWQRFDTVYRRGIRFSMERGRETVARMGSGRTFLNAGIDTAGRAFATLIALGSYRRNLGRPFDRQLETPMLTGLQQLLQSVAQHVHRRGPEARTLMQAGSLLLQAEGRGGPVARAAAYAANAILNLAHSWREPGREESSPPVPSHSANIRVDALVRRHALRVASAVVLAYLAGNWFSAIFAYWAAIAALVVTLPMSANTWLRALERAAGSLIGGLLAAILIAEISSPVGMVLVIVPLALVVIALRLVSYGAFVIFLTPMFMLLADFIRPAEGLVAARFANELIGACIGVAASFLFWPEKEDDALVAAISTAVSANIKFAAGVLRRNGDDPAILDQMQRDAGLASARLETARERMLLEGRLGLRRQDHLRDIILALRSVCGMAAVLEITGNSRSDERDRQRADRYESVEATLLKMLTMPGADLGPLVIEEADDLDRALEQLSCALHAYMARSPVAA